MNEFDEREKAFERKYELDEALKFKINARMGYLLGLWVAEQMGIKGSDAEAYAKTVVEADLEKAGNDDMLDKIEADLKAKNIALTRHRISREMESCLVKAREQIAGKAS